LDYLLKSLDKGSLFILAANEKRHKKTTTNVMAFISFCFVTDL